MDSSSDFGLLRCGLERSLVAAHDCLFCVRHEMLFVRFGGSQAPDCEAQVVSGFESLEISATQALYL